MSLLRYHDDQIRIQEEANSRHVAEKLAHWTGPVERYAATADLFLLSVVRLGGELGFTALSGPPPLVEVVEAGKLCFHPALAAILPLRSPTLVGGLVINLARAERARLNGVLCPRADGILELVTSEMFTLCRKYMAPTAGVNPEIMAGPVNREPMDLESSWAAGVIARAETTFLASVNPAGVPDVAHRGGPQGFLALDAAKQRLQWPEFVGDGVFKSAGNVRATKTTTLLVPDLATGDALELAGTAIYETLLFQRRPRTDPLLRLRDPFPVQGRMVLHIESAYLLRSFVWPRQATTGPRVTSCSSIDQQVPV